MIRKLKTWEAFEKEFRPNCRLWKENFYGCYTIEYFDEYKFLRWNINEKMILKFGKFIEVERIESKYINYTYYSKIIDYEDNRTWLWHELWFEPEFEEFIREDEILI